MPPCTTHTLEPASRFLAVTHSYKPGISHLGGYWQRCMYMAELEELRIPQDLRTLETCSKVCVRVCCMALSPLWLAC